MSKKRKTRQEKVASQLRRQLEITQSSSQDSYSIQSPREISPIVVKTPTKPISYENKDYSYVKADIFRALQIMILLVALNLSFFFLVQFNIINPSVIGL